MKSSRGFCTRQEQDVVVSRRLLYPSGARLTTFYKFHHGLMHIESRYSIYSKSDHPRRTTGHNRTYDIPSHRTACRQMTFFPRTIPEWNSLPGSPFLIVLMVSVDVIGSPALIVLMVFVDVLGSPSLIVLMVFVDVMGSPSLIVLMVFMDVMGSPSLTVLMVSVDVKQQ